METNEMDLCSLEQELAQKASELEAQRSMREQQLVTLTLNRIADGVVSKEAEINTLIEATKGKCHNPLKEIVIREIIRSADDHLWCPEYVQRSGSDQRVVVFTGSYWEPHEGSLDGEDAAALWRRLERQIGDPRDYRGTPRSDECQLHEPGRSDERRCETCCHCGKDAQHLSRERKGCQSERPQAAHFGRACHSKAPLSQPC